MVGGDLNILNKVTILGNCYEPPTTRFFWWFFVMCWGKYGGEKTEN